jgi:lysophospholipase L1-like esterase
VEGFYYESYLGNPLESDVEKKRIELRHAYKFLKDSGVKKLYYKKGDGLIGYDHEGTVDGVHPNDLGMLRIAESLEPGIRKIIR